ncbi:hypothetical protein BN946_scf184908.g64 [Trametes cinnabarina]|uniref:Cyclin N-terminal domain-containing protein n=1 Tax=Pycnoporus cinnabarinus TaxID=5643 RepID=A0A060SA18_PYCCI|nr:hypothetical protein BN946_scf184908.g64 [Trametes cinnabarina]
MPVPVPVFHKQPAHRVIKINHPFQSDSESSAFQHLTHSLPLPPQGPPPSLASREEWISSLPSWRRNKPRRIWEDDSGRYQHTATLGFDEGLTVADNATVIKGPPAQASIPPVCSSPQSSRPQYEMYHCADEDFDDEMNGCDSLDYGWHSEDEAYDFSAASDRHRAGSPSDVAMDYVPHGPVSHRSYSTIATPGYERGAFSPVHEDLSPDVLGQSSPDPADDAEPGSSPIGPATPFAEYVDNAFAQSQAEDCRDPGNVQAPSFASHDGYHTSCYQCHTYSVERPVQQAPAPEAVVTPVATTAYKKLAAPLSDWLANFVWKACTAGMHLPAEYAQPMAFVKHYPRVPPAHLASSVHSMLLSTLLQPSAIFLALWYIVRLPIFFGPVGLTPEHEKEIRFRAELLGEAHLGTDRETIEAYAPFRLVLLGCMLANKWLDDHTFSNKTWHTISNVPIRSLNKLEALALDIFQYDLSITPQQWSDWLSELMGYHASLSSPMFPQPISRPSTSPHLIVRQALEMLVGAKETMEREADEPSGPYLPRPVFVSLDEPKDRHAGRDATTEDVLEIDLDEDGPLREEYLPKRRHSSKQRYMADPPARAEQNLPPPAKWSPSGDEPILRGTAGAHGQYVAPQPLSHLTVAPPPPPLPFHPSLDAHSSWNMGSYMVRQEPIGRPALFVPHVFHPPAGGVEYGDPSHVGHSRSHSLSYNQVVGEQTSHRMRSYSQSHYDQAYGDHQVSEPRYILPPPVAMQWTSYDRIGFPTSYDRPFGLQSRPSLKA